MKSILADFRRSKSAFLTILEALNFDFWKISHFAMSLVPKNLIFRPPQMVKIAVFGASKLPKLISHKNVSGRKILNFPNCVFPIRLPRSVYASIYASGPDIRNLVQKGPNFDFAQFCTQKFRF